MGHLLLINPRNGAEVVDTRWVGHRLIGGFGSLRWSNNSGQYLGLPTRVAFHKVVGARRLKTSRRKTIRSECQRPPY